MYLNTAVFFDFENFVINCNIDNFIKKYQEQFADRIKQETNNSGFAFVKIYADWSVPRFKIFNSFLLEHGMEPVQVFGYSNTQEAKNIADFMMSLDILETALTKPYIENFVICTGDAGFSVIINRLRALGKKTLIYRPERNYSRYLEKLADVCIGMETEIQKRVNINIPVSEKSIVINQPFSTTDLPSADKLNVKVMNSEFLKNFESFGLTSYEADCTKQEADEITIGILQILTTMNLYTQHPQIVASISLLSLLLEHYIEKFNAKKFGHKTLSKYLNDLFTDTPYILLRRNKESQYYVVVSEEGFKKLFPNATMPQIDIKRPVNDLPNGEDLNFKPLNTQKDNEKNGNGFTSDSNHENKPVAVEKPIEKHLGKTPDKQNDRSKRKQTKKPYDKNINKPPINSNQHTTESSDKTTVTTSDSMDNVKIQNIPEDNKPLIKEEKISTNESILNTDDKKIEIKDSTSQTENANKQKQNPDIKMNDYIRVSVTLMLKKNQLTNEEFNKLLDESFCKDKFGIAHPLLKEVSTPFFPGSELYINNKKVYWKRTFKHEGRYYLIYGNWKKQSQNDFIEWVNSHMTED